MAQKSERNPVLRFGREMARNKILYLMMLPGLLFFLIFAYVPMGGMVIAFKQFNFKGGIFGSPWADPFYRNFLYLFTSPQTLRATFNTIFLNLVFILSGTLAGITLALLLNEMTQKTVKKLAQSFTFLPYFMSWIVVSVFVYNIFSTDQGILNHFLGWFGIPMVQWYTLPAAWPFILMAVNIWKGTGYGAVLYLATLSGIDPTYYEAARIDGATRFMQIRYISVPMLLPTASILVLLAIGRIMNADFGMFYGILGDNPLLYPTTDVLDTFIYRNLRKLGDMEMASAANCYQSVVAFLLVLGSNAVARRFDQSAALF